MAEGFEMVGDYAIHEQSMKIGLTIVFAIASFTKVFGSEFTVPPLKDSTVKVLVLPPYDEIANEGISPDITKIIGSALTKQSRLNVIPFPYKQLMSVPYQMVFDKKYCKPIIDKVDCDIIVMSQIATRERESGVWLWSYKIRVYNTRTGKQVNSIQGIDLRTDAIQSDINTRIDKLVQDIVLSFKVG